MGADWESSRFVRGPLMMIPGAGRPVQPKCVASARRLLTDAIASHGRRATRELPATYGLCPLGTDVAFGIAIQFGWVGDSEAVSRVLGASAQGMARQILIHPSPFCGLRAGGSIDDCQLCRTELSPWRRVQWIGLQHAGGRTETAPEPLEIEASHDDSGCADVVQNGGRRAAV